MLGPTRNVRVPPVDTGGDAGPSQGHDVGCLTSHRVRQHYIAPSSCMVKSSLLSAITTLASRCLTYK